MTFDLAWCQSLRCKMLFLYKCIRSIIVKPSTAFRITEIY